MTMIPKDGEQRHESESVEIHDEELDDISGGVLGDLPELRGHGLQPDGGGAAAHR
jgi:hypothetical protein